MTPDKYRFKIPYLRPELCRGANTEETLQDIKFSRHCFVLYSPYDGPVEFFSTDFGEELFIHFLVMMGECEEFYKFLKLAVHSHEKLCKQPKKGMTLAERAKRYVNEKLSFVNK